LNLIFYLVGEICRDRMYVHFTWLATVVCGTCLSSSSFFFLIHLISFLTPSNAAVHSAPPPTCRCSAQTGCRGPSWPRRATPPHMPATAGQATTAVHPSSARAGSRGLSLPCHAAPPPEPAVPRSPRATRFSARARPAAPSQMSRVPLLYSSWPRTIPQRTAPPLELVAAGRARPDARRSSALRSSSYFDPLHEARPRCCSANLGRRRRELGLRSLLTRSPSGHRLPCAGVRRPSRAARPCAAPVPRRPRETEVRRRPTRSSWSLLFLPIQPASDGNIPTWIESNLYKLSTKHVSN
jgi:hypothetical protein